MKSSIILRFPDISRDMIEKCGGKGANLGELINRGFTVPPGFVVVSDAYFYFIEYNKLEANMKKIIDSMDFNDYEDLDVKTSEIRELFKYADLPPDCYEELSNAYNELAAENGEIPLVAVRSSNAIKGTNISSFPGMMDTYHYIQGIDNVIYYVKKCWASLWTRRAAVARTHKNIDYQKAIIAPVVQKMVDPEVAGVMFTANPMNLSTEEIVIESNWGLGESVVSGKAMTDFFILDKKDLTVKQKRISNKMVKVVMDKENLGGVECDVEPEKCELPTLNESQLVELGKLARSVESCYGAPQDIEWAIERGQIFLLQTRKIKGC